MSIRNIWSQIPLWYKKLTFEQIILLVIFIILIVCLIAFLCSRMLNKRIKYSEKQNKHNFDREIKRQVNLNKEELHQYEYKHRQPSRFKIINIIYELFG